MVSLLPKIELLKIFLLYLAIIGVNLLPLCLVTAFSLCLMYICLFGTILSEVYEVFPSVHNGKKTTTIAKLLNLESACALVILYSYVWQKTHQVLLSDVAV